MSQRLIFIAGLTHSGSTILDFLLGAQSPLIGLGEVVALLDQGTRKLDDPRRLCSCGCLVRDCVFWGEVRKRLSLVATSDLVDRYALALNIFTEVFGPDAIPVDSSKSLRALRIAVAVRPRGLQVIHLTRDVRSWTVSRRDVDVKQGLYRFRDLYANFGVHAWRPFLIRNPYAKFLVWYFGNRQLEQFLTRNEIPHLGLSYEDLCFVGEPVVAELCAFVGSDIADSPTGLSASRSHVALGNSVRLTTNQRSSLKYDSRWFYRSEWVGPSVVFPRIMRYNRAIAGRRVPAKPR